MHNDAISPFSLVYGNSSNNEIRISDNGIAHAMYTPTTLIESSRLINCLNSGKFKSLSLAVYINKKIYEKDTKEMNVCFVLSFRVKCVRLFIVVSILIILVI